jgi:hypothetical protein
VFALERSGERGEARRPQWRLVAALAWAACLAALACERSDDARPARRGGLRAAELAEGHCGRCHLVPSPSDLPAETWPFVLTWMSHYLGLRPVDDAYRSLVAAALVPAEPALSRRNFERLSNHFVSQAPPRREFRLPPRELRPLALASAADELAELDLPRGDFTTLLRIDPARGELYVGLGRARELRLLSLRERRELWRTALGSEPIDVEPHAAGFRLTLLGSFDQEVIAPGAVLDFERRPDGRVEQRELLSGLPRPTQSRAADLDGDGALDLAVAGFGNGYGQGAGKLSVFWGAEPGARFEPGPAESVLLDRAGALGVALADFDGDGRGDLLAVTAQALQQLVLWRNLGERRFEERVLLRQPPSWGYNGLEVADFDGDGRPDLLTVNGNNMEIPDPPLRPYHGLRIYLNRPDGTLREAFFYPMYGALRARAADVDGDGDLDLAAIAFFPDWEAAEPETFTLLENRSERGSGGRVSEFRFEPSTLVGSNWSRWLSLDVADGDGDGRPEIALGAANLPGGGLIPSDRQRFAAYRKRLHGVPALRLLRAQISRGAQSGSGS